MGDVAASASYQRLERRWQPFYPSSSRECDTCFNELIFQGTATASIIPYRSKFEGEDTGFKATSRCASRRDSAQQPTVLIPPGYDESNPADPVYLELDERSRGHEHYSALRLGPAGLASRKRAYREDPVLLRRERGRDAARKNTQRDDPVLLQRDQERDVARKKTERDQKRRALPDPADAVALLDRLHEESGYQVSRHSRRLRGTSATMPPADLAQRIADDVLQYCTVTEEDKLRLVSSYADAMPHDALLPGCGTCGSRDPQHPAEETCTLEPLPADHWIRYSDADVQTLNSMPVVTLVNEDGAQRVVETSLLKSHWRDPRGNVFHVHPELVDSDGEGQHFVFLCPVCSRAAVQKSAPPPPFTIAAGVDFGLLCRLGMDAPSELEALALADARACNLVATVHVPRSRATQASRTLLRGHMISFLQDGPAVLGKHFDDARLANLLANVQLVFVGPNGKTTDLERRALAVPALQMRTHVLYNHLAVRHVLGHVSDISLPSVDDLGSLLASLRARLAARARHVADDAVEQASKPSDVANVRDVAMHEDIQAVHLPAPSTEEQSPSVSLDPVGVLAQNTDPVRGAIFDGLMDVLEGGSDGHGDDAPKQPSGGGDAGLENGTDDILRERTCARELRPMSEFTNNDDILYGALWYLFPLRQGLRSKGSVNFHDSRHLLTQFHNAFAQQPSFLFLLANQIQRHAAAKGVGLRAKTDPDSFQAFASMMADKDACMERARAAKEDPTSKGARDLLKEVMRFTATAGKVAPWSGEERAGEITKLYAMWRRFGPASAFLTCAPDDVHQPEARGLRATWPPVAASLRREQRGPSLRSSGDAQARGLAAASPRSGRSGRRLPSAEITREPGARSLAQKPLCKAIQLSYRAGRADAFPTCPATLLPVLHGHASEEAVQRFCENSLACAPDASHKFALDESFLQALATMNPVATTLVHEQMAESIFTELAGLPPNHRGKKTVDAESVPRGFLGTPFGWSFVHETNQRKSFNFHASVHAGASPALLADVAGFPALQALVCRALDTVCRAYVSPEIHALDLARRLLRQPAAKLPHFQTRSVECDAESLSFDIGAAITAVTTGLHQHASTCHKGAAGKDGCRMARPAGHPVPETRVLAVKLVDDSAADSPEADEGVLAQRACANWECADCRANSKFHARPPAQLSDSDAGACLSYELCRPRITADGVACRTLRQVLGLAEADVDAMAASEAINIVAGVRRELGDLLARREFPSALGDRMADCSEEEAFKLLRAWRGMTCRNAWLVAAGMYMCKYMVKDAYELAAPLSVLADARDHVGRYPSSAVDAGAGDRAAKHFLQRVLNSAATELAPTQAAAIALGTTSSGHSHSFVNAYVWDAVHLLLEIRRGGCLLSTASASRVADEAPAACVSAGGAEQGGRAEGGAPDVVDAAEQLDAPVRQGTRSIYKTVDGESIAVSQAEHYAHRSLQLLPLSFDEFAMSMQVAKKARRDQRDQKPGRRPNPTYELLEPHPLAGQCEIKAKAKFDVPIFVGQPPPRLPPLLTDAKGGATAARQRKERLHAEYFTAVFAPWHASTATGVDCALHGWQTFLARLEAEAAGRPPAATRMRGKTLPVEDVQSRIAQGRLFRIEQVGCALTSSTTQAKAMNAWRCRNRTLWKDDPLGSAADAADAGQGAPSKKAAEDIADLKARAARRADIHAQSRTGRVSMKFQESGDRLAAVLQTISNPRSVDEIPQVASRRASDRPVVDADSVPRAFADVTQQEFATERQFARDHLAVQQCLARARAVEMSEAAGLSQMHLLQGAGGVGKSVLLGAMKTVIAEQQLGAMAIAAWTGVASAPFGSPTLRSLLKIDFARLSNAASMTDDAIQALRADFTQAACRPEDLLAFLVAEALSHVDVQLRRLVNEPDAPFGGIAVILVGDFWQKPPPGGISMAEQLAASEVPELMRGPAPLDPTSSKAKGLALFRQARRTVLSQQMRVADDPTCQRELLQLRETSCPTPVPSSLINHLREVSPDDARSDPAWAFATIAVLSNYERHQLNRLQVEAFAKAFQLPLITWKCPLTGKAAELLDSADLDELYDNEPGLWGCFVRGAPAMLTENIQPTKFLVNGACGYMHSLTLQGDLGGDLDIGAPLCINFQLSLPDGDDGEGIESPVDDAVVVPILCSKHPQGHDTTSLFSCVKAAPKNARHRGRAIALAFAATDYKLQGEPKDNLILSIAPRPFPPHLDLKGLCVDVSRARKRSGLRVLRLPPQRVGGLKHLYKLRHTGELAAWNAGHDAGGSWSRSLADAALKKPAAKPTKTSRACLRELSPLSPPAAPAAWAAPMSDPLEQINNTNAASKVLQARALFPEGREIKDKNMAVFACTLVSKSGLHTQGEAILFGQEQTRVKTREALEKKHSNGTVFEFSNMKMQIKKPQFQSCPHAFTLNLGHETLAAKKITGAAATEILPEAEPPMTAVNLLDLETGQLIDATAVATNITGPAGAKEGKTCITATLSDASGNEIPLKYWEDTHHLARGIETFKPLYIYGVYLVVEESGGRHLTARKTARVLAAPGAQPIAKELGEADLKALPTENKENLSKREGGRNWEEGPACSAHAGIMECAAHFKRPLAETLFEIAGALISLRSGDAEPALDEGRLVQQETSFSVRLQQLPAEHHRHVTPLAEVEDTSNSLT
ncbi:unnamed protein product [Prorocentrum cordatum]|uniref:ATP-dependent DNA helicase n=1 Tax=Prorocentrum cordatum TaxID=2364126 RepID=A0ABN9Q272_9DINO|nr:unnamed protein product [Polarella glacialis]